MESSQSAQYLGPVTIRRFALLDLTEGSYMHRSARYCLCIQHEQVDYRNLRLGFG
jgi:hypothetical protein